MAHVGQKRRVYCPECRSECKRRDSRRTTLPRIIKVRLYHCAQGHQFETAETVVGRVTKIQRAKILINRYTVRREETEWRSNDYRL